MPMRSQQQRKYLWATDPELAREFEDKTPKGTKLPKKVKASKKQAAFERGFREMLVEKVASEWTHPMPPAGHPLHQFFQNISQESLSPDSTSTLGKIPQLVPTDDAKPATRAMLEILRDPMLSKVERNALMTRLRQRLPIIRPGGASETILGAGLPHDATNSMNMYLAAQENPHPDSFLSRILRMGMLAANRIAGPYQVTDRRKTPEEERYSPWKISLL